MGQSGQTSRNFSPRKKRSEEAKFVKEKIKVVSLGRENQMLERKYSRRFDERISFLYRHKSTTLLPAPPKFYITLVSASSSLGILHVQSRIDRRISAVI